MWGLFARVQTSCVTLGEFLNSSVLRLLIFKEWGWEGGVGVGGVGQGATTCRIVQRIM